MKTFKLTERIMISKNDPSFKEIDELAFRCKNLRNSVIYYLKQIRIRNHEIFKNDDIPDKYKVYEKYPSKFDIVKLFKDHDSYKEIGNAKISQNIIESAFNEVNTIRKSESDYFKNPSKYKAKPRFPKYKNPETGRYKIILNPQTLSSPFLKKGFIKTSLISKSFKFRKMSDENVKVKQVDIVPRNDGRDGYDMLIIYDYKKYVMPPHNKDGETFQAGMDLGLNILSAVSTTSGKGFLFNGKPLKSVNYQYNQRIDKAKSKLPKDVYTSSYIQSLYRRRENKINNFMHKCSRKVIDLLKEEFVSEVFIGHNEGWKQEINLGKKNNRNFVEIPFNKFIHMVTYKGELEGIEVKLTEEAYTSKSSALDKDQLFKYGKKPDDYKFSGTRTKRGQYKSKEGILCNADSNGSFNMIRKCNPAIDNLKDYRLVVMGCVVHPEYVRFDV